MQQTANQGYNLVENTDEIQTSLNAWNGNFNKLDSSVTSVENGVEALSDNYEPNTVEGTNLYITDSASAPIKDISIGENSEITQDGEPTPEDEAKVNVVEGNITLVDQSKNIVDWGNPTSLIRCTQEFKDDVLTVVGEGINTMVRYNITQFFKNHPGKKIHFGYEALDTSNFNSPSTTIAQLQMISNEVPTYMVMGTSGGSLYNYTIPEDTSAISTVYLRIITNNDSHTETTSKLVITKPQLELGEVSTSNAKYGKQSYPITLPNGMFLGKIGNASNYIYGDIDNWKLHKGIDVLEDMSTLTSNGLDESKIGLLTPTLNIDAGLSSPNLESIVKCNSLPSVPNNNSGLSGTTDSSKIRIYLSTEYASTYEEAKTFLANKNTKIYYARSTSEDILITDETLISQLNNIKRNMTTYKDGTIIFTLTDGLNPSIKLTYGLNHEIEINEKIEKVQSELDMLKSNFDVKTSPNSDNMNITDAINSYIPVDDEGNRREIKIGDGTELEQETTTGKNLVNLSLTTQTINGVTFTVHPDKTVNINGTVGTGGISLRLAQSFSLPVGTYKITDGLTNKSSTTYFTYVDPLQVASYGGGGMFVLNEDTTITNVRFVAREGQVLNNLLLKLMITLYDVSEEPYEQYTNGASPNPDYPQDINVVEGECGVEESTENLFDKNSATTQVGYFRDTGEIASGGNSTITTSYTRIVPNVDYTISGFKFQSMCFYDANYNFIKRVIGINSSSYTFNENAYYIRIQGQTINFNLDVLKLEQGLIATSYVPHKGKSFPITLPEGMFLGSIGTASNYIYGTKDNWKLVSGVGKSIIGTLSRASQNYTNLWYAVFDKPNDYAGYSSYSYVPTVLLEKALVKPVATGGFDNADHINYVLATASNTKFWLGVSNDVSLETIKSKVEGSLMYYPKATPTETTITDPTLISQLNNIIDNLQTYKGGTVVFTSGESLAPNIQFDYLQNPLSSIEARLDLLEA